MSLLYRACCALGSVVLISVRLPSQEVQDKAEARGKAAIVAHSANIRSFTHYKCKYRCIKGVSRSIEDALQGKLADSHFYDVRLLVDGSKDLYEGLAPLPDPKHAVEIPGKKGTRKLMMRGPINRYLSDGKGEMNYHPVLSAINLFSRDKGEIYDLGENTPLGMGFFGHRGNRGLEFMLTRKDQYDFSLVGPQEIDGRPVITVRFDETALSA